MTEIAYLGKLIFSVHRYHNHKNDIWNNLIHTTSRVDSSVEDYKSKMHFDTEYEWEYQWQQVVLTFIIFTRYLKQNIASV